MGEATYYAKVRFADNGEAEKALPKIEAFLRRMKEADNRWQETRGGGKEADDARRIEFPEVFELLKLSAPTTGVYAGDYSNYCAGLLDSPHEEIGWKIFVRDASVCFCGIVWHFADWEPLMLMMKEHFGAVNAGYVSDEYAEADYFEMTEVG